MDQTTYESEDIPDEVRCFICTKMVEKPWQKRILLSIAAKDSEVVVLVIVCPEDLDWVKNNRDAATALVQSRLDAKMKDDKDINS